MAALVAAAHRHHKLTIVHALTLHNAQEALEAGVDGLGHLIIDAFSATFGQQVVSQHAFVIITLPSPSLRQHVAVTAVQRSQQTRVSPLTSPQQT